MQEKFPEVCVQLVDLNKTAGSRYLLLSTYNALKSFFSKHRISRTLSMEILLYVSANRQINEAIRRVGITADTQEIAAVAVGPSREAVIAAADLFEQLLGIKSADELLDSWPTNRIESIQQSFGITPSEISATLRKGEGICESIERLAIERSALLTVKK
jgi:tRNA threonylcarbamoyladenosine modification (KEOPS) complex Cgi121 subunit